MDSEQIQTLMGALLQDCKDHEQLKKLHAELKKVHAELKEVHAELSRKYEGLLKRARDFADDGAEIQVKMRKLVDAIAGAGEAGPSNSGP